MRSGTSFFDWTVYRKTFTRFWPIWTIHLVIWLFILPFNGIMQQDYGSVRAFERFVRNVGDYAQELGLIYSLVFALVVAMAVCSHLYNHRSANFMGALPTRREGLFLSTWLAGLTMMLAPNVLIFLLTLLVEVISGVVMWIPLLYWLAAMCGMQFFFYCFAVCLGQFTGHVLVLPFFYAIFNAIVVAVYGLVQWIMRAYYFGYTNPVSYEGFVTWCTPVVALLQMGINVTEENGVWVSDVEYLWVAAVYAGVAVVLTVCAMLFYRRRHLETAADIVSVRVMRPVFKYGVALCAGLFLGLLMYEMFGFTQLALMIAVVLWGIVGYFVAQMLLDKTLRVFKKWKGAAAVAAVLLILFAVIGFDITGYETRIPTVHEVESVRVSGLGAYPNDSGTYLNVTLTEPESISAIVNLHQTIVEYGEDGEPNAMGDYYGWNNLHVTYQLKSGGTISRRYSISFGPEMNVLTQQIRDLYEVRYKTYELDVIKQWQSEGAQLEKINIYCDGHQAHAVEDRNETLMLWNAVMADFEAGNIGLHVVETDQVKLDNVLTSSITGKEYTCDLEFRWAKQIKTEEYNSTPSTKPEYYEPGMTYRYMQIVVLEQSVETREVLEQLMAVDNRYQDNPNDNPLWRSE